MKFTSMPRMAKIRQKFNPKSIESIEAVIRQQFDSAKVAQTIKPGESVAITVGSRGICNIYEITKALVGELKNIGARPFIVPSMGSHGGATADGQKKLLSTFDITEESMGVAIRSSMEVVQVGEIEDGLPVFIDKYAYEADHIFVANRVKPHTDFEGANESGLMKMMAIGLGKQKSADGYHSKFMVLGCERLIVGAARVLFEKCNIPFGLAIVENEIDETQILEIIPASKIEQRERELLVIAKKNLPKLPFDHIDLLIVDQIGKHYSGTGMDQNVIARANVSWHVAPSKPSITRIFVRDLDPRSGGNGIGIGNADFTTARMVEKYDRRVSYMNSVTAAGPELSRIPTYLENDKEAIETAYKTLPVADSHCSRVVWIKNTLHLEEMFISEIMVKDALMNEKLEVIGGATEVVYDIVGNLLTPGP